MMKKSVQDISAKSKAQWMEHLKIMDRTLSKYIDINILDENEITKTHRGYFLYVQDIEQHDKENLLEFLFSHDDITRSIILDRMQYLINERLEVKEMSDKYSQGLRPIIDERNGEITWAKRMGGI